MSRELRICPGVGSRKCGTFLSSWDRDPHPTCTRCRGRVCTRDMTGDVCVGWSPSQWEAFAKKRAYKDRKRSSRPSGALPTAEVPSPRAGTSLEVLRPETSSSSSSLPSGGQAKREGSRDAPCAASRGASSPPARPRSSERGGSVSGRSSGARKRASATSAPSGAGKREVARSQRIHPAHAASSVASRRSSQHALRRGVSGESSRSTPFLNPPVFPDLRIEEQGRIEPALGRTTLVTGPVVLNLTLLTACGQAVESVGGGTRLDPCPPASGHAVAFALRKTGHDPRIVFRRAQSRSSDRDRSRQQRSRSPARREVAVTVRGHAIPLAALVTAVREDNEPDVNSRSVWSQT